MLPVVRIICYVSKENTNENKRRNSTTNANIFIENLSNNQIKKLTSSNGTKKLINGTFDWAYEEEFNCRDGFLFNNSGTKIAFWQIDANQVRDFYMINNTDSIYSFNVPVEYPKVGQNPSPAKIGIIDLTNNTTFCGGNITQCYDPPKPCMLQSAGGKKTNVKINIKKFNNMVKRRLRVLRPRFRISNPSLNMLRTLLV